VDRRDFYAWIDKWITKHQGSEKIKRPVIVHSATTSSKGGCPLHPGAKHTAAECRLLNNKRKKEFPKNNFKGAAGQGAGAGSFNKGGGSFNRGGGNFHKSGTYPKPPNNGARYQKRTFTSASNNGGPSTNATDLPFKRVRYDHDKRVRYDHDKPAKEPHHGISPRKAPPMPGSVQRSGALRHHQDQGLEGDASIILDFLKPGIWVREHFVPFINDHETNLWLLPLFPPSTKDNGNT
jgi:hypothetical protein